jgi:hypothetical protein
MTINLGRLCHGGAFILADTHSYQSDGNARKDGKILHHDGEDISFAITDASSDANAAKALLSTIGRRFAYEAKKWSAIEKIATREMTSWYKAYKEAPATYFTGAIMFKGRKPSIRLCTFEPPKRVTVHEGGYASNGVGGSIADLIHDLVCEPIHYNHPQLALREAFYLLYRVDKANVYCRGIDGYFLDLKRQTILHINREDIKEAFKFGFQLDTVLSTATLVMLGAEGKWFANNVSSVGAAIEKCDKLRKLVFRDVAGNELGT